MEEKEQFEVRDMRPKGWYWTDDKFLNGYARILGTTFSMIYISLCRYADKNQKAFPAQKKIAEELALSRATVNEGIKVLRYFGLIKQKRIGKQCTNRYWLLGKKHWRTDFSELKELKKKFKNMSESEVKEFYNTYKGDVKELKLTSIRVLHHGLNSFTSNSKETQKKGNTKERNVATKSQLKEFSFKSKLEEMKKDKKRHIQIIALYWEYKNFQFANQQQYQAALKRELRPAKALIGYPDEEIVAVMDWLCDNVNFPWKLETIHKFIDENLDELEPFNNKGRNNY